LIVEILRLRKEKATLLGFADFADLVLGERMAKSGAAAQAFVAGLREKTDARFGDENAALEAFAKQKLEPWDTGYWAEKQRLALYDFDEEELRPYFPLDRVMPGNVRVVRPAVRHPRRQGKMASPDGTRKSAGTRSTTRPIQSCTWVVSTRIGFRGRTSAAAPGWIR